MFPPVVGEALHPQTRPNDFGVWGFVLSELRRRRAREGVVLAGELQLRFRRRRDSYGWIPVGGRQDVGDVVAVGQVKPFGFGLDGQSECRWRSCEQSQSIALAGSSTGAMSSRHAWIMAAVCYRNGDPHAVGVSSVRFGY